MASFGIWTVRVLRKLPHTEAFDAHLTRCVFAEVLFDENLTLFKILGWARIERGESHVDMSDEAVQPAVFACWIPEHSNSGEVGKVIYIQNGSQAVH